jgi:nitroreductase
MIIPASRWYEAIAQRRSRRQFDRFKLVSPEILESLSSLCREFRPFPHARAELVTESAERVFRGIIGQYGKITGASSFIAFIGDITSSSVQEEIGYTGEGIVLEATALGLGTCWVGGFFRPEIVNKLVRLQPNEKVLAVTPIGYASQEVAFFEKLMTGFERSHHRLPLNKMVTGLDISAWPKWLKTSLEAARLAPSAINRQPWGFTVSKDSVTVYVRSIVPDFSTSKRLDCGIAMLHIEAAASNYGIKGNWEFLPPPLVARFYIGN